MIQGLMMTPPVVGRIAIGKLIERNGKRLPEKDDEFTITTQMQNRQGWVLHPMDAVLRSELAASAGNPLTAGGVSADEPPEPAAERTLPAKPSLQSKLARRARAQRTSLAPDSTDSPNAVLPVETVRKSPASPKLRSIPVRLLFNDPELNLRACYTLFDRVTARPICVGDGHSCKRVRLDAVETHPCPGPDHCALGMDGHCKLYGRFHVRIDHPHNHSDACSTFVLRTTGVNTVRTLMARMQYVQAFSGGLLAYLALELRLRGKSTAQSHRAPIYYVDLCVRQHMRLEDAVCEAREAQQQARSMGLDQEALDATARAGYAQGLLEDTGEDATEILREFYPLADSGKSGDACDGTANPA